MTALEPKVLHFINQNIQQNLGYVGRYKIIRRLAIGGMAEVFLGQMQGPNGFEKQVVVKKLIPELAQKAEVVEMFQAEGRISAGLGHPNIVHTYDVGVEGGEHYMVMEYLEGMDLCTLRDHLTKSKQKLPLEFVVGIASAVASALDYAHNKAGVVHRDITPDNILLTTDGGVKLIDFGIAKPIGINQKTAYGTMKGKLSYMSPEQVKGGDVDLRSDIYSLGVVLYELITGHGPYASESDYELIQAIVEGSVIPPSKREELPAELENILLICMAQEPELRYHSTRELQIALEEFSEDQGLRFSSLRLANFLEVQAANQEQALLPTRVFESSSVAEAPVTMPELEFSLEDEPYLEYSLMLGVEISPDTDSRSGLNLSNTARKAKTTTIARTTPEPNTAASEERISCTRNSKRLGKVGFAIAMAWVALFFFQGV